MQKRKRSRAIYLYTKKKNSCLLTITVERKGEKLFFFIINKMFVILKGIGKIFFGGGGDFFFCNIFIKENDLFL